MIFGVQYERFPNPRAEDWDADIKRIGELGIALIRTWVYWRKVNPEEGVWDFSHYDRLFDTAQKYGVRVQIQLFAEAPPEFLVLRHPEWLHRNLDGEAEKSIRRAAQQIGGFHGFDLCNPEPRARAEEYIRRVAERYRGHPSLYGYDLWNEIWMSQWLDSRWIAPQRAEFLRRKYGDVEALGRAYVESYRSFEEVEDPRVPGFFGVKTVMTETYADNMDAMEFENHIEARMMRWRADTLRRYDDAHPVMAHIGGAAAENLLAKNGWEYAGAVDVWGVSEHTDSLDTFLFSMQACRDTAGGKPWWLAEDGSGGAGLGLNAAMRSADFLLSTVSMACMLGAEGLVFWQYRPEISGMESPNYGLVRLNGEDTPRSLAVAGAIRALRRNGGLLNALRFREAPVAIVYSPSAGLFDRVRESGLYREFCGWNAALAQNGCLPRIVRDTDLAGGVPEGVKLLVLPMELIEAPGLRDQLLSWVTQGGTLVASGHAFLYDDRLYAQREYPGRELFGANECETDGCAGEISLFGRETGRARLSSGGMKIGIELGDALPIGAIEGEPAVAVKAIGAGKSVWFGCMPGRAHGFGGDSGLAAAAGGLLRSADILPEAEATGGIVTRMGTAGGRRVLFAVNLSKESVCSWIMLNGGDVARADDILSGRVAYDGRRTDRFPVRLSPEQSMILVLDQTAAAGQSGASSCET